MVIEKSCFADQFPTRLGAVYVRVKRKNLVVFLTERPKIALFLIDRLCYKSLKAEREKSMRSSSFTANVYKTWQPYPIQKLGLYLIYMVEIIWSGMNTKYTLKLITSFSSMNI